jgi:tryptophan synthase beta chain
VESAHAIAHALKAASARSPGETVVVCLSGRGDKDVQEVARLLGREI